MNVTGKTRVYAKTFSNGSTAYNRKISFKDAQGTWYNVYEPLTFKGGDPVIDNRTDIMITNAFESGYIDSQGNPKRKLVVMDWEPIEEEPSGFAELTEQVPF